MTKREWQIEMANRFAKRGMAKEQLDTKSYLLGRYDSTNTLTDAQNTIRQLAEKLECYERLVDSINMASNPMGVKSRVALRNPRVMTKEEEIRKAVEAEREACAKVADEYANGLERNYSEIIADLIRARSKHD